MAASSGSYVLRARFDLVTQRDQYVARLSLLRHCLSLNTPCLMLNPALITFCTPSRNNEASQNKRRQSHRL